jgi:phi13 family phage major tail protein
MTAEQKSVVGLRDLYYALVTQDDAGAYAAGTPVILAPAVAASHKPKNASKVQYADDGAFDTLVSEAETEIELEVTNVPLSVLATVLGKQYDAATGRMFDNSGAMPPDCAIGFRSIKSNGKYKYFWYLKGKFSMPDEEQATLADTPDPKTLKVKFTAVKTIHPYVMGSATDGVKRVVGDEDIAGFSGTTWFSNVQVPVVGSPGAFTCTPSPIDGATGQSTSVAITLTFSNALAGGMEDRITLTRVDTAAPIALTRSLNAARTVLTLGHAALTAAKTYLITVPAVKDVYGQSLAETIYDFATA